MSSPNSLTALEEALRDRRLEVERVEDTFNVSQGTGITAHKANIDPLPLQENLSEQTQVRHRQIAAFASGVKHVLLEPVRSSADEWDFVESAGRLAPAIHSATFELGVRQAAGKPAWTRPFVDDLRVVYFLQLDRGLRVLTTAQVEDWGVTDDRITSAARSLLFHKTRNHDFSCVDNFESVRRLHVGDGLDAARCLVVADAFYSDVDEGFRFSLPSPDHFLAVFDGQPSSIDELQAATDAVYGDTDEPLSTRIFAFELGKPIPIEEHDDE